MIGDVVRRIRLDRLLDRRRPITIVQAASGYGKTTQVRSWLGERTDGDIVWIDLGDERPLSRHEFWERVLDAAAPRRHEAAALSTLDGSSTAASIPIDSMIEWLGRQSPLTLVFDQYQALRALADAIDEDILAIVRTNVDIAFIIMTRSNTRLAAHKNVVAGVVQLISQKQLEFTADEAEGILDGLTDSPSTTERIRQTTLAYPLAVRAAAFALENRSWGPELGRDAWSVLVTENLSYRLKDPALVRIVEETCVPPFFDDALASELSTDPDIHAKLRELEWEGFGSWAPHADGRVVFRYAEALRRPFLQRVEALYPERFRRQATIAAMWLRAERHYGLALELAIRADSWDLAATLVRLIISIRPESSLPSSFGRSLRTVPEHQLTGHPLLGFGLGLSLANHSSTRALAVPFLRSSAMPLRGLDSLGFDETLFHLIMRLTSVRLLGDLPASREIAELAHIHYRDGTPRERDGLGDFEPMAVRELAYSFYQVGDPEKARDLMSEALTVSRSSWSMEYSLAYAIGLSAMEGDIVTTRRLLARVDRLEWPPDCTPGYLGELGRIGVAIVCVEDTEFDRSRTVLDALLSTDHPETWSFAAWTALQGALGSGTNRESLYAIDQMLRSRPGLSTGADLAATTLAGALATTWLAVGDVKRADSIIRTRFALPAQLAPARMLRKLLAGDTDAVLRAYPTYIAQRGHTIRSRGAVLTLAAVAASRRGLDTMAFSFLSRAAALYQAHGSRLHLLAVPERDLMRLKELASDEMTRRYLGGWNNRGIDVDGHVRSIEITAREREVLKTLAGSLPQGTIAASLHISRNTLKAHVRAIYRKLEVNGRRQAVERAIELDLLDPGAGL